MDDEAEMIRMQMLDTRTSMTEKFEAIEDKIASAVSDTTDTVAQTAQAVTDTVDAVKEAVEGTMHTMTGAAEDAVESVKDAFDIPRQVAAHPWLMVGGAVVAGFVGGRLLQRLAPAASRAPAARADFASQPLAASAAPAPSMFREVETALEPVLHRAKGLAIGTTLGLLGQMLLPSVPEAFRGQVSEVVDQLTTALGGERIEGLRPHEPRQA